MASRELDYRYEAIKKYVENILVVYYKYEKAGLDFESDYVDLCHLNYYGAEKFTHYLGKVLSEEFSLENHKGENSYMQWEADLQEMLKILDDYENGNYE